MIHDVKEYFGLKKDFNNAGYFETENFKQVLLDLKSAIKSGHLIALTGIVGCGKTATSRRIREELKKENEIIVSTNIAVDKEKVSLGTLIFALFSDINTEKNFKIPKKLEIRERYLTDLVRRRKKPVALFIDEAHDLHHKTLTGLKRLIEVIQEGGSTLSIILIGHPRLKVNLENPNLEEIGARTTLLSLKGITSSKKEYVEWILKKCLKEKTNISDVFSEDALEFLIKELNTPLQINNYLWKSLVEAYQIGEKPVTQITVKAVVAVDLNCTEARLHRYGYNSKTLTSSLDATDKEIRAFFNGKLSPSRSQELLQEMLKLGIAG